MSTLASVPAAGPQVVHNWSISWTGPGGPGWSTIPWTTNDPNEKSPTFEHLSGGPHTPPWTTKPTTEKHCNSKGGPLVHPGPPLGEGGTPHPRPHPPHSRGRHETNQEHAR